MIESFFCLMCETWIHFQDNRQSMTREWQRGVPSSRQSVRVDDKVWEWMMTKEKGYWISRGWRWSLEITRDLHDMQSRGHTDNQTDVHRTWHEIRSTLHLRAKPPSSFGERPPIIIRYRGSHTSGASSQRHPSFKNLERELSWIIVMSEASGAISEIASQNL